MNDKLNKPLLFELRKYLLTHLGLNFSEKQERELIQRIEPAAKEFEFKDTFKFVEWLLKNKATNKQIEVLASYLTIGETYFLRVQKSFEFLERIFIPNLLQNKGRDGKQLRIWSAGCASGEEPYTIAITLLRTIPNIKDWNITILATDINPVLLKKAEKGIYSKWSFRNNPGWFFSGYFKKVGDSRYQILPKVKNMVTFAPLNLVKDMYPSLINNTNAMDIIFCRNVMIYFSQTGIKEVVNRLYKSLLPGGILIVSPVETSNVLSKKFSKIDYCGQTIYQKEIIEQVKVKTYNRFVPEFSHTDEIVKDTANKNAVIKDNIPEKLPIDNRIKQVSNYEQAVALFKQGLFEQAEKLLTSLLIHDKKNQKQIVTLLAKTKANIGKLDEARLLCERGLALDKSDYSLYYLIATILQEQGNDEEAISSLKKAIYIDHNFALAHFLLGNINVKKGHNSTGKKYFNNAIKILSHYNPDEIVPESDGLTVGRFTEIISAINKLEKSSNGKSK